MPNNLKVFLVVLCVFALIVIYKMVRSKKLIFKHAFYWSILDIILIICVFTTDYLRVISDFIGIEEISNMIFLFGFLVVLAICIALSSIVSEQKQKISSLTQEVGILKHGLRGLKNDQKNNK
jgi:hypothetical protein